MCRKIPSILNCVPFAWKAAGLHIREAFSGFELRGMFSVGFWLGHEGERARVERADPDPRSIATPFIQKAC